jgi:hypothetical protein
MRLPTVVMTGKYNWLGIFEAGTSLSILSGLTTSVFTMRAPEDAPMQACHKASARLTYDLSNHDNGQSSSP